MLDGQGSDAKALLDRLGLAAEDLKNRRRFQRKSLLWAAVVETSNHRIEGILVDVSAGGAKLRMEGPLTVGDDVLLFVKQLDAIEARVVWMRPGEVGLEFRMAPAEIAERVQRRLTVDLTPRE